MAVPSWGTINQSTITIPCAVNRVQRKVRNAQTHVSVTPPINYRENGSAVTAPQSINQALVLLIFNFRPKNHNRAVGQFCALCTMRCALCAAPRALHMGL